MQTPVLTNYDVNGLERETVTTRTKGQQMYQLVETLYPICRSITGNGVRATLNILGEIIPIIKYEIPSGTKAFDWEVPKEWNIRDAFIKNADGEKIVDFAQSNLHVVNYSTPVHEQLTLGELKKHLFSIPEHPDWIPYRTSYYQETWGFCLTHHQLLGLRDETYEVFIDSTLDSGHLTFAECFIPGEVSDEVLISTHICHPSLCNDNLSGISVATFLAKELRKRKLRYSYRFLFIPGTIGAITWLSLNEKRIKSIKHGLVASLLGRPGAYTYKRSRRGNAEIDRVTEQVLRRTGAEHKVVGFSPFGYDERQFCSPGINLPMGSLTRERNDEFPEYHTSADNLDLVSADELEDSYHKYLDIISMLETNRKYLNVNPKCEPQLGRRGLYNPIGGEQEGRDAQLALLWVLNLSDGAHTLLDICETSGIDYETLRAAAERLSGSKLLISL